VENDGINKDMGMSILKIDDLDSTNLSTRIAISLKSNEIYFIKDYKRHQTIKDALVWKGKKIEIIWCIDPS
jgi:hypothetical protein